MPNNFYFKQKCLCFGNHIFLYKNRFKLKTEQLDFVDNSEMFYQQILEHFVIEKLLENTK